MGDMFELVSLILNGVLGTGLLFQFLHYRENKRKVTAEASNSEHTAEAVDWANKFAIAEEWRKIADEREAREIILNKKIDELYEQMSVIRDENSRLVRDNGNLNLKLQNAEFAKCTNFGCKDRQPPNLVLLNYKTNEDNL